MRRTGRRVGKKQAEQSVKEDHSLIAYGRMRISQGKASRHVRPGMRGRSGMRGS
jgi:hypothetical protein